MANKSPRPHKSQPIAPQGLTSRATKKRGKGLYCTATARDGKPCGMRPLVGKKKCLFHEYPEKASECGMKGGRRRAIFNPDNLAKIAAPKNSAEILALYSQTIMDVRSGLMEPKTGATIATLAAGFLNALEVD